MTELALTLMFRDGLKEAEALDWNDQTTLKQNIKV